MKIQLQDEIFANNGPVFVALDLVSASEFKFLTERGDIFSLSEVKKELDVCDVENLFCLIYSEKEKPNDLESRKILLSFERTLWEVLTTVLVEAGFTREQALLIKEKAWEEGHAYGYPEVMKHCSNLVDFCFAILAKN